MIFTEHVTALLFFFNLKYYVVTAQDMDKTILDISYVLIVQ